MSVGGMLAFVPVAPAPYGDRRRSYRVVLADGLPVELAELGPARAVVLSLGGTTIVAGRRPLAGRPYPLRLSYGGAAAELAVSFYETVVHELYYGAGEGSRIRYRSRGRFVDPSVPALNLLYRILLDHWDPDDEL